MATTDTHRLSCLTQEETHQLFVALAKRRGPVRPEEIDALLSWAHAARFMSRQLEALIAGEIGVDVVEGQVLLIAPEGETR